MEHLFPTSLSRNPGLSQSPGQQFLPRRSRNASRATLLGMTLSLMLGLCPPSKAAGGADHILLVSRVGHVKPEEQQIIAKLIAALAASTPAHGSALGLRINEKISSPADNPKKTHALAHAIDQGREFFIEGAYDKAIAILKPAISALGRHDALLATDGQLRRPLQKGLLFLAHAYLRKKQNDDAIATMTEAIRFFPNTHPLLARYGPDLVKLFGQVNNDLRAKPRATLTLRSKIPGCSVFLNGRYIGVTPTKARDLLPGRYRVYMQRPNAPGRVHLTDVSGTDREVLINHALDAAIVTQDPVGLRYASTSKRRPQEHAHAIAIARALNATKVTLVGFVRHLGRRVIQGQILGATTGRILRSGLIAVEPSPSEKEIKELASFLLSGKTGEGVILGPAKETPPKAPGDRPSFMSMSVWRWITLGLGIALTGAGIPLLAINGTGSCAESRCPDTYHTLAPGIILTAVGGGALVTSAIFFILEARRPSPKKQAAGHPQSTAHIEPWINPGGAGIRAAWRF